MVECRVAFNKRILTTPLFECRIPVIYLLWSPAVIATVEKITSRLVSLAHGFDLFQLNLTSSGGVHHYSSSMTALYNSIDRLFLDYHESIRGTEWLVTATFHSLRNAFLESVPRKALALATRFN